MHYATEIKFCIGKSNIAALLLRAYGMFRSKDVHYSSIRTCNKTSIHNSKINAGAISDTDTVNTN